MDLSALQAMAKYVTMIAALFVKVFPVVLRMLALGAMIKHVGPVLFNWGSYCRQFAFWGPLLWQVFLPTPKHVNNGISFFGNNTWRSLIQKIQFRMWSQNYQSLYKFLIAKSNKAKLSQAGGCPQEPPTIFNPTCVSSC